MTPTEMDQLTETSTPESPDLSPPAAPPGRVPSAWRSMFQARERRWWTIALALTILVSAGGVGLLYLDDSNNQATIRTLTTENEQLRGHGQILQDQLNTTEQNLTATLAELARTKDALEHPTVTIWNVPEQIKGSNWYLAGGVPDTFTYHLHATASGPISVSILTLEQFAKATSCVENGVGNTNYCMHHSGVVRSWLGVRGVDYDFHDGEGCADYVVVFTSATTVTVQPNVSVTYNPASKATGACA